MFRLPLPAFRAAVTAALCACGVAAQAPNTLNTTFRASLPLTSGNLVTDVTGFTFGTQKLAVVCRGTSGAEIVNATGTTLISVAHLNPSPATASIHDAVVDGNVLYLAQQGGSILRFDVTAPATPLVLSSFGGGTENLFLDGNILFAARGSSGGGGALEIWQLNGTAAPTLLQSYDPGASFLCRDVTVKDGRAYAFNQITTTNYSTEILDVSMPTTPPTWLGTVAGGGQSGCIYTPPGGFARILVCCTPGSAGFVQTWDVTYFAAPVFLAQFQTTTVTASRNVRMAGTRYAFVANYLDGLQIVDLANPSEPTLAGFYDMFPSNIGLPATAGAYDVHPESEGRLYVTTTVTQSGVSQGLHVVDFTPPAPYRLTMTPDGLGGLTIIQTGSTPGTPLFNVVSSLTLGPFGKGPILGMGFDALAIFYAYTMPPFQTTTDAGGGFFFQLPPGSLPGYSFDLRAVAYDVTSFQVSELGRVTL
ncbi:MAG TPA: hypothetical protein VEI02_02980 [Planctomycetota bacterium]|nr:hypothetical protein [Planctomycetota bacterium]